MLHKCIPYFYREIITYFNETKENKSISQQCSQNIWRNNRFTYKNETLCFTNWIRSGILKIEELFHGMKFKDITDFSNLQNKNNWLCEYKILAHVFF